MLRRLLLPLAALATLALLGFVAMQLLDSDRGRTQAKAPNEETTAPTVWASPKPRVKPTPQRAQQRRTVPKQLPAVRAEPEPTVEQTQNQFVNYTTTGPAWGGMMKAKQMLEKLRDEPENYSNADKHERIEEIRRAYTIVRKQTSEHGDSQTKARLENMYPRIMDLIREVENL